MRGTTTNAKGEAPGLALDKLLQARELLKPALHYRVSDYMPIIDEDGEPFCVSVPESELLAAGAKVAALDTRVIYIHPVNLPKLMAMAERSGFRLEPADKGE